MNIKNRFIAMKYSLLYNSLLYVNKNNSRTNAYKEEGLRILSNKVDNLPEDIAFRPRIIHQSSCIKVLDKLYLFISKNNLYKPAEEKFDALFHEVGHWLHFQNMPSLAERKSIWSSANIEKIKQDVSEYAVKKHDGREFVAEVFKGLVKGKKYDNYIMGLYEKLRGPKLKKTSL